MIKGSDQQKISGSFVQSTQTQQKLYPIRNQSHENCTISKNQWTSCLITDKSINNVSDKRNNNDRCDRSAKNNEHSAISEQSSNSMSNQQNICENCLQWAKSHMLRTLSGNFVQPLNILQKCVCVCVCACVACPLRARSDKVATKLSRKLLRSRSP